MVSRLSVRGAGQEVTLVASVPLTDERWTPLRVLQHHEGGPNTSPARGGLPR